MASNGGFYTSRRLNVCSVFQIRKQLPLREYCIKHIRAVKKVAVTAGARSPRPSASADWREGLPQTTYTRMRGAIVKAKGELLHNITMEPEEKGEKFKCNEILS